MRVQLHVYGLISYTHVAHWPYAMWHHWGTLISNLTSKGQVVPVPPLRGYNFTYKLFHLMPISLVRYTISVISGRLRKTKAIVFLML